MEGRMSTSAQGAPRKTPFDGWWMVWLGGFLSSLNKTAVNKGFPVFVAPVRDGFGASNAAVSFIFSLARAESGPTGPMAGWCRCGLGRLDAQRLTADACGPLWLTSAVMFRG